MPRLALLVATAIGLTACGKGGDDTSHNMANATAATEKPAYCFFKDSETKGWAAIVDKAGDVVVKGKAYRQDSRYKAVLGGARVTGTNAEVSPSITVNDTGYGAPENWWGLALTIPNSSAVEMVKVTCGSKTIAELKVPRKT